MAASGWRFHVPVQFGDGAVAAIAVLGALWGWSVLDGVAVTFSYVRERGAWFLLAGLWALLLQQNRPTHAVFSLNETIAVVARAFITGGGLYMAVYFLAPRDLLPRIVVLQFLALAAVMTLGWRVAHRYLSTRDDNRVPVALVGSGSKARSLARLLEETAPHKKIVAFVEDGSPDSPDAPRAAPVVGVAELHRLVTGRRVSELFMAPENGIRDDLLRVAAGAQERKIDVVPLPAAYEQLRQRLPISHLEAASVLASLAHARNTSSISQVVRRVLDLAAGCAGCAVLLVLLPVIAPAVWLDVGRPIFFRQERVGLAGRRFDLLKFRTMRLDAEQGGPRWARVGDPRAGWFGRFLRRSHLDEMPQFWNVLRGDMSLVGPRPERPEFVEDLVRRIPCYRQRLLVRPGLTGWAQVNFPYGSSVDGAQTKLEYDLYYIKHRSLWLDAVIAWQTVWTVVSFSGR